MEVKRFEILFHGNKNNFRKTNFELYKGLSLK